MNRIHASSAAVTLPSSAPEDPDAALVDLLRRACDPDPSTAHQALYELRPRLVRLLPHLGVDPQDTEDLAHDILLTILERRLRPQARRGEPLAFVLRLAGELARKRADDSLTRWAQGIDDPEPPD